MAVGRTDGSGEGAGAEISEQALDPILVAAKTNKHLLWSFIALAALTVSS